MRLKRERKKLGLTMAEFGELLNPPASDSIVSRWERGIQLPNKKRKKQIAEITGVSTEELFGGEDMINKILDLVLRINEETEHAAWFELSGHVSWFEVKVAPDKEKNYNEKLYSAILYYDEAETEDFKEVYVNLLSFLPKEKRPVTRPVEEKIIYHTILPQKEEF